MVKVIYNGRARKLYDGARGGHYVLSSGRKVYLKVKGAKKKPVKKKSVVKKKPVKKKSVTKKKPVVKKKTTKKKKKKSPSGLRMPRMSNLKRFKLFGGAILSETEWLDKVITNGRKFNNNDHKNEEYKKYKTRTESLERKKANFESELENSGVNTSGKKKAVEELCEAFYSMWNIFSDFPNAIDDLKLYFKSNPDIIDLLTQYKANN